MYFLWIFVFSFVEKNKGTSQIYGRSVFKSCSREVHACRHQFCPFSEVLCEYFSITSEYLVSKRFGGLWRLQFWLFWSRLCYYQRLFQSFKKLWLGSCFHWDSIQGCQILCHLNWKLFYHPAHLILRHSWIWIVWSSGAYHYRWYLLYLWLQIIISHKIFKL